MAEDRKRWWHVAFISGFFEAVARAVALGFFTPNQNPYDREANPLGWRQDQLATCGWVDARMELLVEHIKAQTDAINANTAVQRATLALLNDAHFRNYSEADYADNSRPG